MKPNSLIPSKYRHFIEQNAWMVGGNILFAIGVNMIVTPLGLYNGGFMGLAQLLRLLCVNVLHIPVPAGFDLVGVIYFLENVPLFFVAYKVVGKEFCFKSLVSIGIASLALALVPVPATPIMHDTLAACFVGGVIAPGFPLMRDYLYERTAKLPRMKLGGACPKIGRSTEEAMRFGALVGYRGMVREIVTTLARNFRTDFNLVATGGFAKWVLRDIGMPFVVDPTLTLHGAGLLAAAQLCAKTPAKRKGTRG